MSFWNGLKIILIPPNKGDIYVRSNIATETKTSANIVKVAEDEKTVEEDINQITRLSKDQVPISAECKTGKMDTVFKYIPRRCASFFRSQNKIVQQVEKLEEFRTDNDFSSPLDTFIGYLVDVTGSVYMLVLVVLILIGWIIWGAITGAPDTWQIVMQDGQSIQTYVWDTFLMRQQLDDNEKFLILSGKLKSRLETHRKLISRLQNQNPTISITNKAQEVLDLSNHESRQVKFKKMSLFDKASDYLSQILGNLYSVIVYWIGVFVWVGCGALPNNNGTRENPDMQTFSNNWQMYINTAVAIELLFTSVFLEHVRFRSNEFILQQIEAFEQLDRDLECLERQITSNSEENDLIVVPRVPRNKIQRGISFYANVIGNGLGLIISTCVFITWFGIGDLMHWSANWWLVIGTYTGLVGFIDGFVLREVFFSLTSYEHERFQDLFEESQELLDRCGIPCELQKYQPRADLNIRLSLFINNVCSNEWSVIASCVVVIGLIAMACGLLWSETAQLICNTPTMIIEGFFLLILIQAHNWAGDERSATVTELTKSRMLLYNYVAKCFGEQAKEYGHEWPTNNTSKQVE